MSLSSSWWTRACGRFSPQADLEPTHHLASCLRLLVVVVCCAIAAVSGTFLAVLAWSVPLVVLEVLATLSPSRPPHRAIVAGQVVVTALAVATTSAVAPAVLPLVLLPAFRAGQHLGAPAVLAVTAVQALGALLAYTWQSVEGGVRLPFLSAQWVALAAALGLLGAWNARLDPRNAQVVAAREAGRLLGRLQGLAQSLPTGLDAPAVAHLLLEELSEHLQVTRAAVLAYHGTNSVTPLAVYGTDRVPWRDPINAAGTLHQAWATRRTAVDIRQPEGEAGRRRGSAMICLPLTDGDDELIALVVLERLSATPFSAAAVARAERATLLAAPRLHAALAFSELRAISTVAERERLAREMHDGVAQDLVALGFSLDMLSRQLQTTSPAAATQVRQVRGELSRVVRDIRLSIAALKSTVQPERGLGAALSSQLQSFGSVTGITVNLSLRESSYRLPAHVESVLLRVTQDFLASARVAPGVTRLSVSLEADPPRADVRLLRDGGGSWTADREQAALLARLGGLIQPLGPGDRAPVPGEPTGTSAQPDEEGTIGVRITIAAAAPAESGIPAASDRTVPA